MSFNSETDLQFRTPNLRVKSQFLRFHGLTPSHQLCENDPNDKQSLPVYSQSEIYNQARQLLNKWEVEKLVFTEDHDAAQFGTRPSRNSSSNYCAASNRNVHDRLANKPERTSAVSTLERIQQRHQILAACRVLRSKNGNHDSGEKSIHRRKATQGNATTNELDCENEEKLIQEEMTRVRKELAADLFHIKETKMKSTRATQGLQQANRTKRSRNAVKPKQACSAAKEKSDSYNSNVKFLHFQETSRTDTETLRQYFGLWRYAVFRANLKMESCRQQYELRSMRRIIQNWHHVAIQERYRRELEKTRVFEQELKHKQEKAVFFRSYTLKLRYIQCWRANFRWLKVNRQLSESQQHRQMREREFLTRLSNVVQQRQAEQRECQSARARSRQYAQSNFVKSTGRLTLSRPSSNHSLRKLPPTPTENAEFQTPRSCSCLSSNEHATMKRTISQQRQRIAAQNREIAALKSFKKQIESKLHTHEVNSDNENMRFCSSGNEGLSESPSHAMRDTRNAKSNFLIRMEERAARIAQARAEREERRKVAEELKQKKLAEQLEEVAKRVKEQKRLAAEARKAKRLQEEQLKIQREAWLETQRRKIAKAKEFRRILLLRYFGLNPWLDWIKQQRGRLLSAADYKKSRQKRVILTVWHNGFLERTTRIMEMADTFYKTNLTKRCIQHMYELSLTTNASLIQANAWYEQTLMRKVFDAWSMNIKQQEFLEIQLSSVADMHHDKYLKLITLLCWKRFPALAKSERARNARLERLRRKIKNWVPDFNPPDTVEYD